MQDTGRWPSKGGGHSLRGQRVLLLGLCGKSLDFHFRPQMCLGCPKHCEGHRLFTVPMFSWKFLISGSWSDFWKKKKKQNLCSPVSEKSIQHPPAEHMGDRARAEPCPAGTCPTKLTEGSKKVLISKLFYIILCFLPLLGSLGLALHSPANSSPHSALNSLFHHLPGLQFPWGFGIQL